MTGKASVFNAAGAIVYTGVATTSLRNIQKASFEDKLEVEKLKDARGKVIGLNVGEESRSITIDFIPAGGAGADNTLAHALAALVLPTPLAAVTLSGFDDAAMNGTWTYMGGGKKEIAQGKYVMMTLPLEQFLDGGAVTDTTTAAA